MNLELEKSDSYLQINGRFFNLDELINIEKTRIDNDNIDFENLLFLEIPEVKSIMNEIKNKY